MSSDWSTNKKSRTKFRKVPRALGEYALEGEVTGSRFIKPGVYAEPVTIETIEIAGVSRYPIVDVMTDTAGRKHVRVTEANGRTQFPVRHHDGTIGYDFPEVVTEGAKLKVAKAFERVRGTIGMQELRREYRNLYRDIRYSSKADLTDAQLDALSETELLARVNILRREKEERDARWQAEWKAAEIRDVNTRKALKRVNYLLGIGIDLQSAEEQAARENDVPVGGIRILKARVEGGLEKLE